jgi:pyochelin biosynthetic protein PchC
MTPDRVNLVCLPHAGGSAAPFRRWRRGLGGTIAVHPLDYPGRGARGTEPAITDSRRIIEDVALRVTEIGASNCVLFGHSMGAWVAYEAAVALERAGEGPAGLIVSAASSPAHLATRARNGPLRDDQLRAKCLDWGGTPAELLDDPAFRDPLFTHLRADLATIDTYVPSTDAMVDAPMTALAGRSDRVAPSREVAGWAGHARDWYGLHVIPGGHFFTATAEELVVRVLAQHCRAIEPTRQAPAPTAPTID